MRSINIDDNDIVFTSIVSKQGNSLYCNINHKIARRYGIEVSDIVTIIVRNKVRNYET